MEVQAITKNVRMSAQKMREVVRQIQGLPAVQALAVLEVVPRKGARVVGKTLAAAMANAEHLRSEWTEAKLKQAISDLEGRIANTRNHKRQNKQQRELAQYQGFLSSSHRLAAGALVVKEAVAQTASTLRRFTPKARGSAGPILKRSCHVRIVLSDQP
jgi:large subunit ribosomal protein L22